MSQFKYRFQAIEEIKEKIKKNSEKEYAISRKIADSKKNEIEMLQKELDNSFIQCAILNAQEMIFLENYRTSLTNTIEFKSRELLELEKECEEKLAQLVEHHKDHRVFEKLKEKHHEEFLKDQSKSELKSIDEMANQKFNRKEK